MYMEKDDEVLVYEQGKCTYSGRVGDLPAKRQQQLNDATHLFRLDVLEEGYKWLVIFF